MKKTFPFHAPDKSAPRVLDAIKHDVRKYVKRERRKDLPEGFDEWDFDCRVGATSADAAVTPLKEIAPAIDAVAQAGGPAVYVEILARAATRAPRAAAVSDPASPAFPLLPEPESEPAP